LTRELASSGVSLPYFSEFGNALDEDKKPGDATTVEELIEMPESQGGERKK